MGKVLVIMGREVQEGLFMGLFLIVLNFHPFMLSKIT